MTKEELAKKKGKKVQTKKPTPAETLLTKEPAKKATRKKPTKTKPKKETSPEATAVQAESRGKTNPVGRPKNKPSTKISLNIENELHEYAKVAAYVNTKGNLSAYISTLIENDVAKNQKKYDSIMEIIK